MFPIFQTSIGSYFRCVKKILENLKNYFLLKFRLYKIHNLPNNLVHVYKELEPSMKVEKLFTENLNNINDIVKLI